MEPFEYDDYSEFDADELDYEPPIRSISRKERNRLLSPELEYGDDIKTPSVDITSFDEDAIERIRTKARNATRNFLDDCDSARVRAQARDKEMLAQIDASINQNSVPTKKPWHRTSLASSKINHSSAERAETSKKNESVAKPPSVPREVLGTRRRRSIGMPPPNVMDEINSLEAFGRDTRPLHEKISRSPLPNSRFIRSVTPGQNYRTTSSRPLQERVQRPPVPPSRIVRSMTPGPYQVASPRASSRRSQTPKVTQDKSSFRLPGSDTESNGKERLSTMRKLRDVETKLENILDYEMPYQTNFKDMRNSLREINDKMARHRLMIDRYSGLQMKEDNQPIQDRIFAKVEELVPRVPALSGVQHQYGKRGDDVKSDFDPRLVPGYSTGLCITPNESNRELRGRIRNLLCRTRETSKKDAANPHLKPYQPRQRELTVE